MDKWKLVSKPNKQNPNFWDKTKELQLENWELYDMQLDRTEMNNLVTKHPDITSKMADMWMRWAKRVGAVPRPL